ncbi:DUF5000 domain-containing lipoprotein [Petrimonas mucosa]|uniref:DUF5000 domain-containing lipoprotein n=1 Tax=Petrimonas mucosa TaxID=1642646 RepID=UPI0023EFD942|nr:DUF5000 domain-containing lipoprotein [Petrimonas mucosa]MDD3561345.1 DUF5000 domain-containing lipoprotein [Petrimonas mucosa]
MKKISLLLSILFCAGPFLFNSCKEESMDESIPLNPVLTPIKAVTAQDGDEIVSAVISDRNRTIELSLKNLRSLSSVDVNLSISKRAKLLSPQDTILTLDLSEPYQIVINNLYKDVTYTLTATIPEYIEIDKSKFREFRLNNDSQQMEGNIVYLWDGGVMSQPENYGEIGYRNYLTGECFTVDMGDHYNLKSFKANLYWAYTNVCPKKYELWGYEGEGEPPIDGDWSNWTKLGSIDNSSSTLADFAEGDVLEFAKEESLLVRYIRVKCLENYRNPPTTAISLCEITLWAWNM